MAALFDRSISTHCLLNMGKKEPHAKDAKGAKKSAHAKGAKGAK
jgi:hypothetical protein